jgi:hypothetical protein
MRRSPLISLSRFRYVLATPAAAGLALFGVALPAGQASAASGDCTTSTVVTCTFTPDGSPDGEAIISNPTGATEPPAFTAGTPPLTAATGAPYSYQFTASGTPAPKFSLGAGAPSWLTVNSSTGIVSGRPPAGTKSFSYSMVAGNSAGTVTAGPFTVPVSAGADMSLALSCPATLVLGHRGTCTLTVTNNGPALATNVAAGASISVRLKVTGCSSSCLRFGGVVAWSLGSLPAGRSDIVTIGVTAASPGTAVSSAADNAANPDRNQGNNLAVATVKIRR